MASGLEDSTFIQHSDTSWEIIVWRALYLSMTIRYTSNSKYMNYGRRPDLHSESDMTPQLHGQRGWGRSGKGREIIPVVHKKL